MAESDDKKLTVEEQVARIKAAKEAAKRDAADKAAKAAGAVAPVVAAAPVAAVEAVAPVAVVAPIVAAVAPVVAVSPVAPVAAPAPGSVEEKVAQIKAAKAAAAAKTAGGGAAPVAAVSTTPPAPGSVEEKVAQIKAAKAAAAAKAAGVAAPVAAAVVAVASKTTDPGTPEAIARAAAAHEKAQGATGINATGAPANRPAVQLLAAAAKKPATATTAAKKNDPELPLPPPPQLQERRAFLGFVTTGTLAWTMFWGWMAAVGGLFTRFMFPNVLYESDPKFSAGRRNDFPESPKVYEKYKQDQAVWIVRLTEEGQDRLVALSTVCTHLGCTPNWLEVEQKYKCPCHGSGYYMDGVNFEGPTPRPLERFKIYVDATGNIIVDKAKKYRQDLQQWNENQSFITMG
ncbi:MAG: ubiquinol-cytochrome c reductase iron-sulfur subunit [Planctomycetota bacterium]